MDEDRLFPGYIARDEEQQILEEVARVRESHESRAVLLYGSGGVGKTSLVRQLASRSADPMTVWIDPVDIDDSTYWLLSNLEQHVAGQLDPENQYFGPYFEYLSRMPSLTGRNISYETVVSHFGRIKEIFTDCYQKFINGSNGKMAVIVLDTVEIIRGLLLLVTLTQWMKDLPATLFILSGRPLPDDSEGPDPIVAELEDPYKFLPVRTIPLGEFSRKAALGYLNSSGVAAGLAEDEKVKLIHLTRGHPLWLAFTIDYLKNVGIPEEAGQLRITGTPVETGKVPLADTSDVPFRGEMTARGQSLYEAFKRRLVAPYQQADFWHEAIKRLAVVREGINEPAWRLLMKDHPLPEGMGSLHAAWQKLLVTPWIRPRANRRYVTLHDAVAEELAQRIIQLHDQDKQWRKQLWQRATGIYTELTADRDTQLAEKLATLDETLQALYTDPDAENGRHTATEEETRSIRKASRLVAEKRELAQLNAVRLHYQLLSDFEGGCRQFLEFMERAKDDHDILFQDLLAFELQRFLPGDGHSYAFGDAVGEVIGEFRRWLHSEGRELHLRIGLSMADYLIKSERPDTALALLEGLPETTADATQRYRLSNLRGNACMRIRGQVREALKHFQWALAEASDMQPPDRLTYMAKAHKELGFYYRNAGLWEEADRSYQEARDAISATLSVRSSSEDREEMASIQTNWAYVKGLGGHYRDGTNLVESAIDVRHRLERYQQEGNSWSVCGEVYRYGRRFQKAWDAYGHAEQIFQGLRNWAWLGLIYQEQAICLFQAAQEGTNLTDDPAEAAKQRITRALDLCRDLSIRSYPSALNRAGRIFGEDDPDLGLQYLERGIREAHNLWDGWFWFANLVEYAELCYRTWVDKRDSRYRDRIVGRASEIDEVTEQYEFPDLKGRWELVQGHLDVHDWMGTSDQGLLDSALRHYTKGFLLIAQEYVGSSGAAAIPDLFKTFRKLVWKLPEETRALWQDEFRRAWAGETAGATLLLARLEELY